eukprot:305274_1
MIGDVLKSGCTAIFSEYNHVEMIDGFNHLLYHHHNEYEHIHDILNHCIYPNTCCQLSKCLFMKRNQRDRDIISKHNYLLNKLYSAYDVYDITSQQLLDRIHCFFFHCFDTGFKLTNEEKQSIFKQDTKTNEEDRKTNKCDVNILKINQIVSAKQNTLTYVNGLNRLNGSYHRFQNKLPQYSYGLRFHYWKYGKHDPMAWLAEVFCGPHSKWNSPKVNNYPFLTVENKYQNLKEELINNDIYVINHQQYNVLMRKAHVYIQTNKIKHMFCPRRSTARCYDMYHGQLMSIDHLISMMVYCNFDILQTKFSETLRRKEKTESNYAVKQRHSNYYFLARLLIECAQCFGMECSNTQENVKVYHGTNQRFSFWSMNMYIKGAFSTTASYAVAQKFSNNQGMILELDISILVWRISAMQFEYAEVSHRIGCVDMQWVSDFPNEQEVFCFGGLHSFECKSIIHVPSVNNYKIWIQGLNTLVTHIFAVSFCTGAAIVPTFASQNDIKVAFRLLSQELHHYMPDHPKAHQFEPCPQYITEIVHSHCINVDMIIMGVPDMVMNCFFQNEKTHWINLFLLKTVFPNSTKILYQAIAKNLQWLTGSEVYQSVLKYIKTTNNTVDVIWIEYDFKYEDEVIKCVEKYKNTFEENSWLIEAESLKGIDFGIETDMVNTWLQMDPKIVSELVFQNPQTKEVIKAKGFTDDWMFRQITTAGMHKCFIRMQKKSYQPVVRNEWH